jgi:hypothetical protein
MFAAILLREAIERDALGDIGFMARDIERVLSETEDEDLPPTPISSVKQSSGAEVSSPRRTPDLETSHERIELVNTLARELATIKPELNRFCTIDGLKRKFPGFTIWNHLEPAELKDLVKGEPFTATSYAQTLVLRKYGITSRETLKKDRRKLRNAGKKPRI